MSTPYLVHCGLCAWCGPERSQEHEAIEDSVAHYQEQHPDSRFISWYRNRYTLPAAQ